MRTVDPREQIKQQIKEAAHHIRRHIDVTPDVAVVLGSGLRAISENTSLFSEQLAEIDYEDIPGFPIPLAPGHGRKLRISMAGDKIVALLEGRFHYYEGYTMMGVTMPVRTLGELGVEQIILTNAAGALSDKVEVGDVMLIRDHINLMGSDPLIGMHDAAAGPIFTNLTDVYSERLSKVLLERSSELSFQLKEGVYVGVHGPSYETKAEAYFYRSIGGDAVGMSTVPEAIVAAQIGLQTLGLSCITNISASPGEDLVLKAAGEFAPRVAEVIKLALSKM